MQSIIEALNVAHPESALLSFISKISNEHGFPVAFWKLPHSTEKHCLIARDWHPMDHEAPFEEMASGFMFAPFDTDKKRILIPREYSFSFDNGVLKSGDTPETQQAIEWLKTFPLATSPEVFPRDKKPHRTDDSREKYMDLVSACIDGIGSGLFEKIVPSRAKTISLKAGFDGIATFQKLCTACPEALVSWVQIPGTGSWMGATPELLVSVTNASTFTTAALAATQSYIPGTNLKAVAWTQKEIEEQALVERYIISCFKKIRLREYEEYGPKTVVAGNLLHLKTSFTVDMKETNFPQLGSVMLRLLHPTSAVCGMPLEPSRQFLKAHEGYDREFYAGYLGPVNIQQQTQLFVNLRCMQILNGEARLYAGAGVTGDSIAQKEWEETEMKLNTLATILH